MSDEKEVSADDPSNFIEGATLDIIPIASKLDDQTRQECLLKASRIFLEQTPENLKAYIEHRTEVQTKLEELQALTVESPILDGQVQLTKAMKEVNYAMINIATQVLEARASGKISTKAEAETKAK